MKITRAVFTPRSVAITYAMIFDRWGMLGLIRGIRLRAGDDHRD